MKIVPGKLDREKKRRRKFQTLISLYILQRSFKSMETQYFEWLF